MKNRSHLVQEYVVEKNISLLAKLFWRFFLGRFFDIGQLDTNFGMHPNGWETNLAHWNPQKSESYHKRVSFLLSHIFIGGKSKGYLVLG